jgi:hypothetical protein
MKKLYELYIEEQATGRFQYLTPRQAKRANESMREGSGLLHQWKQAQQLGGDV